MQLVNTVLIYGRNNELMN